MKKALFGTTAIVALGLAVVAAAPAVAQAPAQGFSSTNFQFTVGGLARGYVGGTGQTDMSATGGRQRFDIQRDYRLDFTARATLPNGLAVGAVAQIAPEGSHENRFTAFTTTARVSIDSVIRRNWVFMQSQFGQVQIGATDNAAFQMFQGEMDAFTAGSVRTGKIYDYISFSTTTSRDDSTFGATNLRMFDRSAEKIAYFSPRIEGFQLGANYTPEASHGQQGMPNGGGLPQASGGMYQRGYAIAANYVNNFSGVGVRAFAGYKGWQTPNNAGTNTGATKANPYGWSVGGGVNYMGFDLGGSYGKTVNLLNLGRGNSGANQDTTSGNLTSAATLDGNAFSAGLGYIMGPARVSVNYFQGKAESKTFTFSTGLVTNPTGYVGDEKLRGIALNGAYTMGPGVNLEMSIFNVKHTAPTTATNSTRNQSATGVLTGLILSF
jgi:outer membrane protein OmpU